MNRDQWSLLLEQGKNLPDHVIFLHDESPNGDLLIKRWYYSPDKVDVGGDADRYTTRNAFFDDITVLK